MHRFTRITTRAVPWLGRYRPISGRDWEWVERIARVTDRGPHRRKGRLDEAVADLRRDVQYGRDLLSHEVLVATFSLVYEAMRRTLGIELYGVQLAAGIALARATIAEMQTGEGKTMAAVAPAVLHALAGRGVHVMTANQYLAQRDFRQLQPVYETLGVSVGLVTADASPADKRDAYRCDVTYGPGHEFGFDYLRDQLSLAGARRSRLGQTYRDALRGRGAAPLRVIQRGLNFAIVDEADNILLDEAGVPLVLSRGLSPGDPTQDPSVYHAAHQIAEMLQADRDFRLDRVTKHVQLTESGCAAVERAWSRLHSRPLRRPWTVYVQQAVKAQHALRRDVDYVVTGNQVRIVDGSTGRIFGDRSWQDGLHQAIEVKEGIPVTSENHSAARISRQRFLQRYECVCGMTGTARGSAGELWEVYRLPVVLIPRKDPCRRQVLPMRFFADRRSKWNAMLDDVVKIHATGQPIMVGTRSIEVSEQFSALLQRRRIEHRLLNGKQDRSEAEIVTGAGQVGAVTVATNMAGRGTDIKPSADAIQRGGLHVMGEEPNDEQRIDRQLMGRSARQGDPGTCQFFVSADDPFVRGNDEALARELRRRANESGEVVADLSRRVARIQRRLARDNRARRTHLLRYDQWLDELMDQVANDGITTGNPRSRSAG